MLNRCANGVRNIVIFERTVLDEACCHQLYRLDQDSTFNYKLGLLNPHAARSVLEMLESEDDASIEVQASAFSTNPLLILPSTTLCYIARGDVCVSRPFFARFFWNFGETTSAICICIFKAVNPLEKLTTPF